MSYDLLIKDGTVVDGTGAPSVRADVAIGGGRIVAIGDVEGNAKATLDAGGRVVAPGVIDVHSHYDAMVCWDGLLGSSSEHGTTTIVQGNCGIGIAPCRAADREAVVRDLVALEGIDYDVLSEGIDWKFETFPQYLDYIRRRKIGINVGAMVPLGPLRRFTMGEAACERAATQSEREEIANGLREAMASGANGFSGSFVGHQMGYKGRPLPSGLADRDELIAYAHVLRDCDRGMIQAHVIKNTSSISDDEMETLTFLSEESGGRFVTYTGALYRSDRPEAVEQMLQKAEPLRRRRVVPQSIIRPTTMDVDFRLPYFFAGAVPGFKRLMNAPLDEQRKAYADGGWREATRAEMAGSGKNRFGETWLDGVFIHLENEKLKPYLMKSVREIAAERGIDPFDAMMDLVLDDDLRLKVAIEFRNNNPAQLREHIKDPRLMIGTADGGAHVDMMVETGYPTYMLGYWVREQNAISLEHAVQRMTSEPAGLIGLNDRGRIATGMAADIMVFDPETVGSPRRADQIRHDLPGGGVRLYASPTGMDYVLVNGEIVYDHNRPTGAMPGQIVQGR